MDLTSTTQTLQIVLAEAVSAHQLTAATTWTDTSGSTTTPGSANNNSNNTTAVTIVSSPAASTQRQVNTIAIYNADTVAATVAVSFNDSATSTNTFLVTMTIEPGQTLQYSGSWSIVNTGQNTSYSSTTSPSGAAGGGLIGTYPDPMAAILNGISAPPSAPTSGQILTATSNSTSAWVTPGSVSGAAMLSGATFTGAVVPSVTALTDGTTISVNASLGNVFTVTLGGNRTLANPTNPIDGQTISILVTQDSTGSRTLTFGTAYEFSTGLASPTLSTAAGATDMLVFTYSASKSKWLFVNFIPTFAGSDGGGATSYITGLSTTGSGNMNWFVDQYGIPRLLLYDNPWGLIPNAGRWNGSGGGTWEEDIDNYCSARGAQGFSATYIDPFAANDHNVLVAGMTWDNVSPFANGTSSSPGTPDSGLNDTYWERVDRFIADSAAVGMTVIMNIAYTEGGDGDIDYWEAGFSDSQFTDMGTAIATRYQDTPNIIWTMGNDYCYFGAPEGASSDSHMSYLYTGLRDGGDTHVLAYHPLPEGDSHSCFLSGYEGASPDYYLPTVTQYSMMYTYVQNYFGIEYAYGTENSTIPVIWGDGYFYQGPGAVYDTAMRQCFWWSVASGARGCISGSESIWTWAATSPDAVTSGDWYTTQASVGRSLIESLPNWWKLFPDVDSTLVTGGRGTRLSSDEAVEYGAATTDDYIAASYVSDGSLALIYFSAGCGSSTITIDEGVMQSDYTATWVDPTNGSKYTATPSSTYSAGTARGNNAEGYADWVLVLQGP